jgi:hypothetical protein
LFSGQPPEEGEKKVELGEFVTETITAIQHGLQEAITARHPSEGAGVLKIVTRRKSSGTPKDEAAGRGSAAFCRNCGFIVAACRTRPQFSALKN